jgi:hypothetical protein
MKTTTFWALILLFTTVIFLMIFIPALIIQPFKAQTPGGVETSFAMRRWSPIVTLILFTMNLILLTVSWKQVNRWWKKTGVFLLILLSGACTWFARQNYFEWMFNPLPDARYVRASDQKFIKDDDMVLAMEINKDAVAYPVRLLAYHHLVNDTVGGTPIVATY